MLIQDRRRCRNPAVNEFRALLNATQQHSLSRLEREGWRLRFVRTPPASMPEPILATRDNSHALLLPDGRLDESGEVAVRD